jgi:hypothetical protein
MMLDLTVSNTEVLLIGYIAASDFNGNYFKGYQYCKELKIVKMLEYSRFIRRLNNMYLDPGFSRSIFFAVAFNTFTLTSLINSNENGCW